MWKLLTQVFYLKNGLPTFLISKRIIIIGCITNKKNSSPIISTLFFLPKMLSLFFVLFWIFSVHKKKLPILSLSKWLIENMLFSTTWPILSINHFCIIIPKHFSFLFFIQTNKRLYTSSKWNVQKVKRFFLLLLLMIFFCFDVIWATLSIFCVVQWSIMNAYVKKNY